MEPDYTGVILGIAGLVVALLTTVANLTYNWLKSRQEQLYEIKRSVYMEICEGIASTSMCIAKMGKLDSTEGDIAQIVSETLGWEAKAHLVGSPTLVRELLQAQKRVHEGLLALVWPRMELQFLQQKNVMLQGEGESTRKDIDSIRSALNSLKAAGHGADSIDVVRMHQDLERQSQSILLINKRLEEGLYRYAEQQQQFMTNMYRLMLDYRRALASVFACIRKELKLPGDSMAIQKMLYDSADASIQNYDIAVRDMHDKFLALISTEKRGK